MITNAKSDPAFRASEMQKRNCLVEMIKKGDFTLEDLKPCLPKLWLFQEVWQEIRNDKGKFYDLESYIGTFGRDPKEDDSLEECTLSTSEGDIQGYWTKPKYPVRDVSIKEVFG